MPFTFNPAFTILKWPEKLRPTQLVVHLQFHTTRFEAPFTRSTQTQELPGARFNYSATFEPFDDAGARLWRATIAKGRGSAGRYYLPLEKRSGPIPDGGQPEAVSMSALTADNAILTADSTEFTADATVWISSTTLTVAVGGSPTTIRARANQPIGTVVIEAGRHLSFDTPDGWRSAHLVVEDAIVGAGSFVGITVEPPMRVQPTAGTPLHIRGPSGIFMLTSDDVGALSQMAGVTSPPSLEAVEARPPRITVP